MPEKSDTDCRLLLVIGILVFYWAPGHDLDKAIVKKLDQELQDPHPMQHRTRPETWSQIEKEELLLKKKSVDGNADASDNVDADMHADADANADVDEGPLLNTEVSLCLWWLQSLVLPLPSTMGCNETFNLVCTKFALMLMDV